MDIKLRNHLIEKYRESIAARYDYETIKDDPNMPEQLGKEDIDELRDFFLDNLYTTPKKREELDAAFKQLETYVAHPSKIWGLLGNIASAILEFGFHFPAAIKIGLASLKTHTSARQFEEMLMHGAVSSGYKPPLTHEQFRRVMATIPLKQLESFIEDLVELFGAITDEDMLDKTVRILNGVLERMREKKDLYGEEDLDAIQLGVNILQKGKQLLDKYDTETKNAIVEYVTYSEMKFIEGLHKGKATTTKKKAAKKK